MPPLLRRAAGGLGLGLAAGLVGTAAMTASSTLEARLRGRADSDAPARALAAVLGVEAFEDEDARARASRLAHWGLGTGLGALRGFLGATGADPNGADAAFHGLVLGTEHTLLRALGLAPPPTRWGADELAGDLGHHTVYALATNATYRWLCR